MVPCVGRPGFVIPGLGNCHVAGMPRRGIWLMAYDDAALAA
jgi:hypothetical protein